MGWRVGREALKERGVGEVGRRSRGKVRKKAVGGPSEFTYIIMPRLKVILNNL